MKAVAACPGKHCTTYDSQDCKLFTELTCMLNINYLFLVRLTACQRSQLGRLDVVGRIPAENLSTTYLYFRTLRLPSGLMIQGGAVRGTSDRPAPRSHMMESA